MTARSRKFRSVFLTVLLVCSLVAATGALTQTGSATRVSGNTAVIIDADVYSGQEFRIDVTQSPPGKFTTQSSPVYLLEVDPERGTINDSNRLLVQNSRYVEFDTADYGTGAYALNDDREYNSEAVNFTVVNQTLDLEWERESVATDTDAVALRTNKSNRPRGEYNVTIRADGFTYDQLRALFIHSGTNLTEVTADEHLPLEQFGFDPDDDGDGLSQMQSKNATTLDLSTSTNFIDDGEIVANFSNLAANERLPPDGEYDFEINVTDSNARDNATLRIGDADVEFREPLYTRAAGDIAEFTVELDFTNRTWVQLRDSNSEFVDVLYLEDVDNDDNVTFYANTRLIGTDHSQLSGIGPADSGVVYYSRADTVESYIHHEFIPGGGTEVGGARFFDAEEANSSNEVTFSQYIQSVNGAMPTDQLDRPLARTRYELVVDRDGRFTIDDGEAAVNQPLGETELDLVQPTVRELDTFVAPEVEDDSERLADVPDNLTSRDTVTIGDRMVLRFKTTGIAGALAAIDYARNGNSIDSRGYGADVVYELANNQVGTDWEGEGVNFTFSGDDRPNNLPRERLPLDDGDSTDAYFIVDQQTAEGDPGTLWAIVDTSSETYEETITDEQQYDAALTYVGDGPRFAFSGQGPQGGAGGDVTDPSFPYFDSSVTENVTVRETISFASRTVTLDTVEDGTVSLEPRANAEVSGTTNLAPGTPLTVGVRLAPPSDALPDEDPSFLAENGTVVDADGTFNVTLDLGDRTVGEAATVRVDRGQTRVASSDAEFVETSTLQRPYFATELDAPATAQRNETVNITGTVTNNGTETGTARVTLEVDGDLNNFVLRLESGESGRISRPVEMGQADIDVNFSSQNTSQEATVAFDSGGSAPVNTIPTPNQGDILTPTPTSTPAPAVDNPQATPPAGNSGGGFPWLFVGVGAAVILTGGTFVVLRWL